MLCNILLYSDVFVLFHVIIEFVRESVGFKQNTLKDIGNIWLTQPEYSRLRL